jgi:hypothetical protein
MGNDRLIADRAISIIERDSQARPRARRTRLMARNEIARVA